jgi:hypothetical protein
VIDLDGKDADMKLQQMLEPAGSGPVKSSGKSPRPAPPAGETRLTARAVANIAEWSTYLPRDCVEAMVRDGWHLTV